MLVTSQWQLFLLPVLAGFSFSPGRAPEKTHSKSLFDHIQINITLIVYYTTILSTHEGLPFAAYHRYMLSK